MLIEIRNAVRPVRARQWLAGASPAMLAGKLALLSAAAPGALLLMPASAQAQCTSAATPTAPASLDFANQTVGALPATAVYALSQTGVTGCNGGPGDNNADGGPGLPGQDIGAVTSTATNVIVRGTSASLIPLDFGAVLFSQGGNGGFGGNGGEPISTQVGGGSSGGGGTGGPITVNFSGSFGVPPVDRDRVDIGFGARSVGGMGGAGGSTEIGRAHV